MASSFLAIDPSGIISSTASTFTDVTAAPVTIQTARGLFMVEIVDVNAGSTLRVTIRGGLSRQFGNPEGAYAVQTNSGLNSNVTINNVGTVTAGSAQTTIVVTDATTTSQFTLIYIPSITGSGTNAPTLQNTGGAAPAGNVTVSTVYLNCGAMGPVQS